MKLLKSLLSGIYILGGVLIVILSNQSFYWAPTNTDMATWNQFVIYSFLVGFIVNAIILFLWLKECDEEPTTTSGKIYYSKRKKWWGFFFTGLILDIISEAIFLIVWHPFQTNSNGWLILIIIILFSSIISLWFPSVLFSGTYSKMIPLSFNK